MHLIKYVLILLLFNNIVCSKANYKPSADSIINKYILLNAELKTLPCESSNTIKVLSKSDKPIKLLGKSLLGDECVPQPHIDWLCVEISSNIKGWVSSKYFSVIPPLDSILNVASDKYYDKLMKAFRKYVVGRFIYKYDNPEKYLEEIIIDNDLNVTYFKGGYGHDPIMNKMINYRDTIKEGLKSKLIISTNKPYMPTVHIILNNNITYELDVAINRDNNELYFFEYRKVQ